MSSSSSYSNSHSSSSRSSKSSVFDISSLDKNNIEGIHKTYKKLGELEKKGKLEKEKETKKKENNSKNRESFISKKNEEKKIIKKSKETKIKNMKNENQKENAGKKCAKCNKIVKTKNFFYHDAFIHDGEAINFKQKRRALNTYINKKMKRVTIIYSDIMKHAKRLKIDSILSPELKHIEKIGFHVMQFNKERGKK